MVTALFQEENIEWTLADIVKDIGRVWYIHLYHEL